MTLIIAIPHLHVHTRTPHSHSQSLFIHPSSQLCSSYSSKSPSSILSAVLISFLFGFLDNMGPCTKQVSGEPGPYWAQTLLPETMPKPPCIRPRLEALKCPRCGSNNTKFCYYNNYNKSQPRHFCKSCKRHWTKGGTLRNVPVGGGRKNKRPKISNASTTIHNPASTKFPLNDDQKSMANILYQALTKSPNRVSATCLTVVPDQNPSPEVLEFSSGFVSAAFEMSASLIPGYYQTYDCSYGGSFVDSMDESTITSVDINASSSRAVPWPSPDAGSALDLPNHWSWNEIEALTAADLNIAWGGGDDEKIEP